MPTFLRGGCWPARLLGELFTAQASTTGRVQASGWKPRRGSLADGSAWGVAPSIPTAVQIWRTVSKATHTWSFGPGQNPVRELGISRCSPEYLRRDEDS